MIDWRELRLTTGDPLEPNSKEAVSVDGISTMTDDELLAARCLIRSAMIDAERVMAKGRTIEKRRWATITHMALEKILADLPELDL